MEAALARLDDQIAALAVARQAVDEAVGEDVSPEIEFAVLGNLTATLARLSTLSRTAANAASREQIAAAPDNLQAVLL